MNRGRISSARGVKTPRIWTAVLGNLLLGAFLVALVCAGVYGLTLSLARAKLADAADAVTGYGRLLSNALIDTQGRAERYADALYARCFCGDAGGNVKEELLALQSLQGDDDVGLVAGGVVTSASSALDDATAAALSGTAGCVSRPDANGSSVFVFAAPISSGGTEHGTLYLVVRDGAFASAEAQAVCAAMQTYSILDTDGAIVRSAGDESGITVDYSALLSGNTLLLPQVTLLDAARLVHGGRFFVSADDSLGSLDGVQPMLRALLTGDLSFQAWYQTPLQVKGWRVVTLVRRHIDADMLYELALILLFGLLAACFAIFFPLSAIIRRIRHCRTLTHALRADPVTGGYNYAYFKSTVAKVARLRRTAGSVLALAAIDVDKFGVYSDVRGHERGELLLYNIYQYLSKHLRRDEALARYSVDQFAMLLILAPEEDPISRMELLMHGVSRLNRNDQITCSAGIYIVSDRKQNVERMYHYASVAKDAARTQAGCRILRFDNAMRDALLREQQIESLAEKALAQKEFVVYLQPKYSVQDHILSGAEALIRWNSPELGFVSPGAFIPLFERNGFILQLDDYMLSAVCGVQRRWMDAGRTLVPVSVNISRAHFAVPNIAPHIRDIVDSFGVPYDMIELELTESAFFDDKALLAVTVDLLRGYGFPVSMDDFGSGFSSLNSLKDLPLDVVKLDKDFFDAAADAERGASLIRDTIALAKHLRMEVVAEGIETHEQVEFLMRTGCDLIQGFYFAKPMPVSEFETLPRQFIRAR